jgi:uncharacterized caspase-like protein
MWNFGGKRAAVTPLKNPRNDATDMAAALRKLGFDVVEALTWTVAAWTW